MDGIVVGQITSFTATQQQFRDVYELPPLGDIVPSNATFTLTCYVKKPLPSLEESYDVIDGVVLPKD